MAWGTWLPTISTTLIIVSAVFVAIGWRFILQGQRDRHKKAMLAGAWFAVGFFTVYVTKTVWIGSTPFSGPDHLVVPYTIFLIAHIVFSTSSAVLGIMTIVSGLKGHYFRHRKLGRVTAVCWLITAFSGVVVYYLLYILYPGTETTGLLDAIF